MSVAPAASQRAARRAAPTSRLLAYGYGSQVALAEESAAISCAQRW
jgi:hypothetical protein